MCLTVIPQKENKYTSRQINTIMIYLNISKSVSPVALDSFRVQSELNNI